MVDFKNRKERMRAADGEFGREQESDRLGGRPGPGAPGERRFRINPIESRLSGAPTPSTDDLDGRSKDELYEIAKRLKIEGRCRMTREQLIEAIRSVE